MGKVKQVRVFKSTVTCVTVVGTTVTVDLTDFTNGATPKIRSMWIHGRLKDNTAGTPEQYMSCWMQVLNTAKKTQGVITASGGQTADSGFNVTCHDLYQVRFSEPVELLQAFQFTVEGLRPPGGGAFPVAYTLTFFVNIEFEFEN